MPTPARRGDPNPPPLAARGDRRDRASPLDLDLGADGRTLAFIQDRDTSDVWLLDLDGERALRALDTTGRDPMPYWEDTTPRHLARRLQRRLRRPGLDLARRRRRAGLPRKLVEAG